MPVWLWAVVNRLNAVPGQRPGGAEDRQADEDAIRRVAQGDTSALAELYDRHARGVYSLALRIVEDQAEAEDVVQEVFSQAWTQASRHDTSRGAVGAWLMMIARSRAIDRIRSRRARPDSAVADDRAFQTLPDPGLPQDLALLVKEQAERLRTALATLPLLQRVALELAYFEGLTQSEIAERLEQPLGTVKTRMRLALLKLREAFPGAART
jgi:RNA polymerase sigma-70 factor (ECF subfamily)